jgi:hypothetical protein
MEATSKGWSEGRNVIGYVLKFGLLRSSEKNAALAQKRSMMTVIIIHDILSSCQVIGA